MLFDSYKLKDTILRNRIVMAPMTRNMSPGGVPPKEVIDYYERRAKGEVGLIITEGIEVSHKASSAYPDVPRLDSKDARDAWKRVVEAIKKQNEIISDCDDQIKTLEKYLKDNFEVCDVCGSVQ